MDVAENDEDIWRAIDRIRVATEEHAVKHATIDGRLKNHEEAFVRVEATLVENRKERAEQYAETKTLLAEIKSAVAHVTDKVSEAHGAARFGKWVAGLLLSIAALAIAWVGLGGKH